MKERSVNFKYKFPDNYNPVYSNGAYGGVNPGGELVLNFYFERNPIPYKETRRVNDSGEFIGDTTVDPVSHDENIIRYISNGVVMNLDSAKSLHEWLGKHIMILEEENLSGGDGE